MTAPTLIPLDVVPDQTVQAYLNAQNCTIRVYQRTNGLYVDVYLSNVIVIRGVLALNMNKIIRSAYLGFVGDLFFYDTQGEVDPDYTGLGGRFVLLYA